MRWVRPVTNGTPCHPAIPTSRFALQHAFVRAEGLWHGTRATTKRWLSCNSFGLREEANAMHEIIYLIGLVVVVMFILGALGIR
jgi:hypothetical protein